MTLKCLTFSRVSTASWSSVVGSSSSAVATSFSSGKVGRHKFKPRLNTVVIIYVTFAGT